MVLDASVAWFFLTSSEPRLYNLVSPYSLDFDGTTGSASSTDDKFDDLWSGGGTFTCWFYARSLDANRRIVDKFASGDGWTVFIEDDSAGTARLEFNMGFSTTNGVWETTNRDISDDTWHHLALVYDDGDVTNDPVIYIDGVAVATTEDSTPVGTATYNNADELTIGAATVSGGATTHDGQIYDPVIFNTALTALQVTEAYNGGVPINMRHHSAHLNLIEIYNWESATLTQTGKFDAITATMTNMTLTDIVKTDPTA